jgi:hypothetical protein
MITLTIKEIKTIVKKNLPQGLQIYGMEGMRQWILANRLDNHGWLNDTQCHFALAELRKEGFLIKEKKGVFIKNPLTDRN